MSNIMSRCYILRRTTTLPMTYTDGGSFSVELDRISITVGSIPAEVA